MKEERREFFILHRYVSTIRKHTWIYRGAENMLKKGEERSDKIDERK